MHTRVVVVYLTPVVQRWRRRLLPWPRPRRPMRPRLQSPPLRTMKAPVPPASICWVWAAASFLDPCVLDQFLALPVALPSAPVLAHLPSVVCSCLQTFSKLRHEYSGRCFDFGRRSSPQHWGSEYRPDECCEQHGGRDSIPGGSGPSSWRPRIDTRRYGAVERGSCGKDQGRGGTA